MKRFAVSCLFLLLGASFLAAQSIPSELVDYPDIIFYNGTILTIDDNFSVAQAIAIRGGKILAVGSDTQVLRLAGPRTQRIDLKKKTVMPGIIDTHVHPNRSAISNNFRDIPPEYQKLIRAIGSIREWRSKDQVLGEIRALVEKTDPSVPWLLINTRLGGLKHPVAGSITRKDLDAISPDRPLFISFDSMEGLINSKVLQMLERYGSDLAGVLKENGVPNGQIQGQPFFIIDTELMPQLPTEILAPLYRKELVERWAPLGHTTFSTRLNATEVRAYILLDQKKQMPLRLAYGLEVGRWNPFFDRDMQRSVAALPGHGTDRVWFNSISVALPDGSVPEGDICSTFKKQKAISEHDVFPEGRCFWLDPGDPTIDTVKELSRQGFRVANIHTYGDKGLEIAVDLFEQLGVGGRRFAMDHTVLFNDNVIKKSGQLGMYWSVGAQKFYSDPEVLAASYDKEVVDRYAFPLKALVDAGAKVTYEASARRGEAKLTPFYDMEMFVTRKDGKGNVWGRRNALDRQTVLKMMTRWGAEYVLKEDKIGTLERSKYADLIVLDRNPLDPSLPDENLSEIKILLTMVEGETVFKAPDAGL